MAAEVSLDRASFLWVAAAVVVSLLPVLPAFPPWLGGLLLLVATLGIGLGLRRIRLPAMLRVPLTLCVAAAAIVSSGFTVGQETGAALLAAMLASKLLETGSVRDGRSACSFALFAVMAGFLHDQGPATLLLALIACTVIVAALARLARVQLPGLPPPPGHPGKALLASARLLVISLPFAFVVFFLFPRFPEPLWGAPAPDDRSRSGLSNDMSPGDIVQMLLDDSPALRVTFEGTPPPRNAMYWRGPVLTDFDGRRWTRWEGAAFTPPADIQTRGAPLFHEVMQEPTTYQYLIGLDVPVSIPENARLSSDRTVFTPRLNQSVRRFRIGSALDHTFQPDLPATSRQHHLRLPQGFNPRTTQLMAEWKAQDARPETLIQRALALFNAEFVYSLTPPPLARDSVDDFLFATKEGYCEHFASAFAVMMRSAGIPSRVVTGYQGGFFNRVGEYWLIRNSDAHAWTEVWLEGRGWVRIDPTSAVAPERIREGITSITPPPGAFSRWSQPLWEVADALRRGWNFVIVDFNAARQRALLARLGLDPQDWRQLGAALAIGIGLALALSFALLWRGGRTRINDPLLAAWRHLVARLTRAGFEKRQNESASAFVERIAADLPDTADALHLLTRRYIAQRYAGDETGDDQRTALIHDLRRFRPRAPTPRRTP
ncbi:DUF3488 and transglutaminase-like domain-containing protein [Xanthomonadaceae bacterium JHOS43]|nr:DUF3488 and transglutaminase-like domain-containing protein [Xanthomonadaceae bacterium JHOS43]